MKTVLLMLIPSMCFGLSPIMLSQLPESRQQEAIYDVQYENDAEYIKLKSLAVRAKKEVRYVASNSLCFIHAVYLVKLLRSEGYKDAAVVEKETKGVTHYFTLCNGFILDNYSEGYDSGQGVIVTRTQSADVYKTFPYPRVVDEDVYECCAKMLPLQEVK